MNNLELNKIYCESNLDTMARMQDKSIDYVLTSPPYNVGKNQMNGGDDTKKYKEFSDNTSEYFEEQKTLILELLRVTKKHIFYNTQIFSKKF
jgi:DNA modification methylase